MQHFKKINVNDIQKLTPRELDVINIMYYGRKNNLGLSPEYFNEVLISARKKLKID